MRTRLTWDEMLLGGIAGLQRNIRCIEEGRHRGGGQTVEDGWTNHITGALAELAVAKVLNLYPTRDGRDIAGDVSRFQVRATTRHNFLIVRSYDADESCFVFVRVVGALCDVAGWLAGSEAKQEKWLQNPSNRGAAYFVPSNALHPMEDLVEVPS